MTQPLFTQETPKPFAEYPPTWAYIVALLSGFFFVSIIAAPLMARRWPSEGWKWGVWCSVLNVPLLLYTYGKDGGLKVAAVETVTSPALYFSVVVSCLLALYFARCRSLLR